LVCCFVQIYDLMILQERRVRKMPKMHMHKLRHEACTMNYVSHTNSCRFAIRMEMVTDVYSRHNAPGFILLNRQIPYLLVSKRLFSFLIQKKHIFCQSFTHHGNLHVQVLVCYFNGILSSDSSFQRIISNANEKATNYCVDSKIFVWTHSIENVLTNAEDMLVGDNFWVTCTF
jgi:hypothetical protein